MIFLGKGSPLPVDPVMNSFHFDFYSDLRHLDHRHYENQIRKKHKIREKLLTFIMNQ